jgi:hypothetical protein
MGTLSVAACPDGADRVSAPSRWAAGRLRRRSVVGVVDQPGARLPSLSERRP